MNVWQIRVLFYGAIATPKSAITPNLDSDLTLDWPYFGFLLQKDGRNILVDTGISDKFFIDGKAWGGYPAYGGREYVEKALDDIKVRPDNIEIVLYTHLHNDHAGNCTLFPKATHIAQRDEWKLLLDPLPIMNVRRDYDLDVIPGLMSLNLLKVDGDFRLTEGIWVYKTPGHTAGNQSVAVETEKGIIVLVGDQWHINCMAFPDQTEIMDMFGKKHKITPAPAVYGPVIPSSLIYDYYDYYDSCYKIKAIATADAPGFIIPGHEPSLMVTGV